MIYSGEELNARLRYWQQVLRLQDWDVEIKVGRRREMRSQTSAAQVWVSNITRTAIITVLEPTDFGPDATAREQDMDDSIVHELLHLHFKDCGIKKTDDLYGPETSEGIAEERAIAAIAAALVWAERRVASA